jgi:hypothetical protein
MLKKFIFAIRCSILNRATEPPWRLYFAGQKRVRSHLLPLQKLQKIGFCRFHKWPISRLWNHQSYVLRSADGRRLIGLLGARIRTVEKMVLHNLPPVVVQGSWQCPAMCSRHRREASGHVLTTDTWHRLILHWDTSLCATLGQTLKCQWSLREVLLCTVCYKCFMYTQKSE